MLIFVSDVSNDVQRCFTLLNVRSKYTFKFTFNLLFVIIRCNKPVVLNLFSKRPKFIKKNQMCKILRPMSSIFWYIVELKAVMCKKNFVMTELSCKYNKQLFSEHTFMNICYLALRFAGCQVCHYFIFLIIVFQFRYFGTIVIIF